MPSAQQLLLHQTADAFRGRKDMSLMAALGEITQADASWRPNDTTPTIGQIVRHVAWAETRFCHEGFGTAMSIEDPCVNDSGDTDDLPWEFPCGAAFGRSVAPGIAAAIA